MRLLGIPRLAAAVPPRSAVAVASIASRFAALALGSRTRAWRANILAIGGAAPSPWIPEWSPFRSHLLAHYESLAWIGGRDYSVRTEGEEHLRAALERRGGLILATAHVGNWVMGGRLVHERTGRAI